MARKPNTETARLLEVRDGKIDQLSQIADEMQRLRDTFEHLQSDIDKLDFALSVLNPDHVPMDAKSSNSGRLLIDAKPEMVEPTTVEAAVSPAAAVVENAATPKRQARTATKSKAKRGAAAKKASTRKAKGEAIPQTAVDAAEKISGTRTRDVSEKELRAREVINGYMANLKPADEIEAILKKGPKRGLTVEMIADELVKAHPLLMLKAKS